MGKKEVITSIVPSIAGPLKKSSPAGYVPVVSLADSDDLAACHHVIIFAIAFKITSLLAPPQHSGIGPFLKPLGGQIMCYPHTRETMVGLKTCH